MYVIIFEAIDTLKRKSQVEFFERVDCRLNSDEVV